ncbi:MAG: hypothetical protein V4561_02360 [Bacteroidota bacterium]
MKRNIILLSFLFISTLAVAQISNTKSLKGAWKEVVRIRSGQKITYRDTLFFEVVSSNLCIWGKSSPTAPRLRLKQIGTTIVIGPSEFEILAQEDNWIKLSTDEGVEIEMIKYSNKKQPAIRNTNNTKYRPAIVPRTGNVPDMIEPLVGIWKCYKRTSIKPVPNDQKYRIIRLVEIEETTDAITAKIYGFDDLTAQPSWIVQRYEKGVLYTSGKDDREFKVINCQPNELIIENEGVVYYMNKM